jgi:hypothetical protein
MTELTTTGRRVRLLATVAGLVLLLAGTFWGQDDDFPFGPFRMYSTAPDPNGAAKDTRVEGVDVTGAVVTINEANPSRLVRVAEAYAEHTPQAPALREVRIVIRWHLVKDSRPTGTFTDEVVADWVKP